MFDDAFRARFAPTVRPVARILLRRGVTATHVTIASFLLAAAAAALVAAHRPYAGLAVWLLSRVGDGLDGVVAREGGSSSPFGGFLDITLDMAAYSLMVLAFAALHPEHVAAWLAILAGYVLVITTTLALSAAATAAARAVSVNDRTFQFTRGLTEAGETSVMYALWVVMPSHIGWLTWVWAAALCITGLQRVHLASRMLR